MRDSIIGSRLYVAGDIVGLSGPLGRDVVGDLERAMIPPTFGERINRVWEENVGPALLDMTVEEVRAEIRKYIARGIDFIKFAESSHSTAQDSWLTFSPEAAQAIVEEGHRAGMIVESHTTNVESLRLAVLAGIDLAQHPGEVGDRALPDSLIQLIVKKGVYCADFGIKKERIDAEKALGAGSFPPDITDHWQANIAKLIRSGAPIAMATDAGVKDYEYFTVPASMKVHDPTQMGEADFLWLEAMVELGMTPGQAITAATRNVAAAYHHLPEFGTVEPEKYADLLVLDADPLENISNVREIRLVMKEGAVIDRERLPEHKIIPE